MKKSKIYVSIPVSKENYVDQRNHSFVIATNLAMKDYDVVTPFDVIKNADISSNEAMGSRITAMLDCDSVFMCMGWEKSIHCKIELQTAILCGKKVQIE